MTIASAVARNSYVLNGVTTVYPYTYRTLAAADLRVVRRSAVTGIETVLVPNVDYTVSGVGNTSGGAITLTSVGTAGDVLVIRRNRAITQPTSLTNQGPTYPSDTEAAIDAVIAIAQQLQDQLDRSLKLPESLDPTVYSGALPVPTAGAALVGTGTGFTMAAIPSGAVALPGAGRTTTTLSTLLANDTPYYVMDFAPVGYVAGVTDLLPAIQAAFTAAAADRRPVILPAGTHNISAGLVPPLGVVLEGQGIDMTVLRYMPTTGDGITLSGAAGLKHILRKFTLAANTVSSGTGLNLNNCFNSEFSQLRIRLFANGVGMNTAIANAFIGVWCDANTQDGFNLGLDANGNTFLNCQASSNGRAGWYFLGARANGLVQCDSEQNAYGAIITAAAGLRTSTTFIGAGCYFEGNTVQEIFVSSQDVGVTKPQGTAIRDVYFNPLTLNTTDAIVVKYADGVDIENVVIDNLNAKAYSHALVLDQLGVTTGIRWKGGIDRATSAPFAYANHTGYIQWAAPQSLLVATEAALVAGQAVEPGQSVQVTLTAARVFAAPPLATWRNGQLVTYEIIQDATGGWNVTWSGSFKQAWSNAGNTAGKRSTITFLIDGATLTQVGAQSPWI